MKERNLDYYITVAAVHWVWLMERTLLLPVALVGWLIVRIKGGE